MAFPLILLRSLRPTTAMEILTAGAKMPSSNERFCARVLGSASFFAACTRVVFARDAVAPARRWWREEQPAGLLRARAADREAEPAEALVVAVAIIFVVGCLGLVADVCVLIVVVSRRPSTGVVHVSRARFGPSWIGGRPKTGFVREVTTGA